MTRTGGLSVKVPLSFEEVERQSKQTQRRTQIFNNNTLGRPHDVDKLDYDQTPSVCCVVSSDMFSWTGISLIAPEKIPLGKVFEKRKI